MWLIFISVFCLIALAISIYFKSTIGLIFSIIILILTIISIVIKIDLSKPKEFSISDYTIFKKITIVKENGIEVVDTTYIFTPKL